jgi:hypothetical protein
MNSKSFDETDYANEELNKVLDIHALIEAIHEYFDPTSDHDLDYLEKRIKLLREAFNLGENSSNENSKVVTELLTGFGQLPSLRLLPFDGALEVPNTLDSEAHVEINKQYGSRINQIRESVRDIQRAYITYVIIHAVDGRLRSKEITLGHLVAEGLPESDPGSDPNA